MEKQIRPLKSNELIKVVEYFHSASDELLKTMGAERSKLKSKAQWEEILKDDYAKELTMRQFFYVGWEYDGVLIGHSNVSHISYGNYANIHLHMWNTRNRERGLGLYFFKKSVNFFFEKFELKTIICEPAAENPAPNFALKKMGLSPVKVYRAIPSAICNEQLVNRYEITSPFVID